MRYQPRVSPIQPSHTRSPSVSVRSSHVAPSSRLANTPVVPSAPSRSLPSRQVANSVPSDASNADVADAVRRLVGAHVASQNAPDATTSTGPSASRVRGSTGAPRLSTIYITQDTGRDGGDATARRRRADDHGARRRHLAAVLRRGVRAHRARGHVRGRLQLRNGRRRVGQGPDREPRGVPALGLPPARARRRQPDRHEHHAPRAADRAPGRVRPVCPSQARPSRGRDRDRPRRGGAGHVDDRQHEREHDRRGHRPARQPTLVPALLVH